MGKRVIKIVAILIGWYLIWVSARSWWDLRRAGRRVGDSKLALSKVKEENRQLQQKLMEIQSPEFIEKEAREKLNLQKPGETVIVLPDDNLQTIQPEADSGGKNLQNWEKWWRLFF